MAVQPTEIRVACIDATTRIVISALEKGNLPTEDATSIGGYYAEVYNWIYASAAGAVKSKSEPK